MTIADETAVISSASRPIEPAGLELAAVGVLAWYLDLWLVPYVLMAVGVFVLVTGFQDLDDHGVRGAKWPRS